MKKNLEINASKQELSNMLPKRAKNAHKGECGHIGILAGSKQYLGAGILSARAALRAGAGLVCLMTIEEAVPFIAIQYPELIVLPLPSKKGLLHHTALPIINTYLQDKKINSLVIGPGLGANKSITKIVNSILFETCLSLTLPAVVDADALNAITEEDLCKVKYTQFILTPHQKEFTRLFKHEPATEEDRILATRRFANKTKQIIVLKGANSVIACTEHHVINQTGNEGMATAGAGDVLSGIIAGLVGQGCGLYEAAVLGCHLHGLAGDLGKNQLGMHSLIASDLINYLPFAFKELQK
jgi:NAD(P)H-hydrate epimerase